MKNLTNKPQIYLLIKGQSLTNSFFSHYNAIVSIYAHYLVSCIAIYRSIFAKIGRTPNKHRAMTSEITQKLTVIETLYSEQEYTINALNEIVIRQDKEISVLRDDLQWLKQQMRTLKEQIPDSGSSDVDELPPHY